MDNSTLGSLLVGNRPTTVVVAPTPTEIVPYKIPTGTIIMSWLIVIQEMDIRENTCYICHNYVHYLSLQVINGVCHEEIILHIT